MFDRKWYERPFDRDTAIEFFNEAYQFTTEVVINYMPEIASIWPLGNELHHHNFNPRGVVIHASYSPSMWNTLHMHTRNVHAAHAIIMSGRRFPELKDDHYPLLQALPANIFMPHPIMTPLRHSGYISTETWGIELRSCCKLRPYEGLGEPTPINATEEHDDNFRKADNRFPSEFDYYWRGDLWRKQFNGKVYAWEGYFYEKPTSAQIETLMVVLMAMNALVGKMDRRIILPSNCISAHLNPFPIIPWSDLRGIVTTKWDEYDAPTFVDELFTADPYMWEGYDLEYYDEGTIGEQLDTHRWRTYSNDGQLESIDWKQRLGSNNLRSNPTALNVKIHSYLSRLGFDTKDPEFALQMYAISRGMISAAEQDIITALLQGVTAFD